MPTMLVKVQVAGEKYAKFEVRSPQEGDSYMEILRAPFAYMEKAG